MITDPLLLLPRSWRLWLSENSVLIQRIVIIPLVLLASVVLSQRVGGKTAYLIIALPGLVAGAVALIRWPALGLLVLVAASLSFTSEIVYSIGLTTIITLGLAGLWFFDMFVRRREISISPFPSLLPFLLLIVVGLFSLGMAQLPWYPVSPAPLDAQVGGVLIFIVAFIGFLMAAHHLTSIVWLKWFTFLFLGIGGTYLALRFIPGTNRIRAMTMSPNVITHSMFWCWLAALSFSQALFNKELAPQWRGLLFAITGAVLYITLFETRAWVSGWFPVLVAIVVVVWVAKPRAAVVLTVVGAVLIMTQMSTIMENLIYVGDNEYSEMTRLEAWRIVFQITSVNPLLGVGPANYSFYTPLFPILGWFVQFNSHNNYVDIIAQTGILGMACLLWLYIEIGRVAWRVYRLVKEEQDGFLQAYVYGTLGGFVATVSAGMLGDWVLPYVYNITIRGMRASILPWLFLGGLVAVEQLLLRRRAQQVPREDIENGS